MTLRSMRGQPAEPQVSTCERLAYLYPASAQSCGSCGCVNSSSWSIVAIS